MDMPTSESAVIPATVLIAARHIADGAGQRTDSWLSRSGIPPGHLDTPNAMVSFRQASTFLDLLVTNLPGRALGIEAGTRDTFLAMGMLGLAMRTAESLRSAMSIGVDLHHVSGSLMDMSMTQHDESTLTVVAHERYHAPRILPFLAEEMLSSIVSAIREALGRDVVTPLRASFSYPPPEYAHLYENFFRCPIVFDAGENSLTFNAHDASRPLPTSDPTTHAAALDATRVLAVSLRPTHDLVSGVQSVVTRMLAARRSASMTSVAADMHVTPRTLRRQLDSAGTTFSEIRDHVRRDHACFLVRDTARPIAEIALDTGYSDAREFRRAYMRWTGRTPSADRRAAGGRR